MPEIHGVGGKKSETDFYNSDERRVRNLMHNWLCLENKAYELYGSHYQDLSTDEQEEITKNVVQEGSFNEVLIQQ